MLNERIQIVFAEPELFAARTLEPNEYRSILHLDGGVQILEADGTSTFYPWQTIHAIRKIPMMDDPSANYSRVVRERAIA